MEIKLEEPKMLCISVGSDEGTRHWYAFDPRGSSSTVRKAPELCKMRKYPSHLDKCIGFGTAVVDSRYFYLIGGMNPSSYEEDMNTVHIFDTVSGDWSQGPSLKKARVCPFVLVIQRKIYVFGANFVSMNLSVDNWGEYYDLDGDNEWKTISAPRDADAEHFLKPILDAVVVHKDNILFWGNDTGIYAYNHRSNVWTLISPQGFGEGPKPPFNFMSNHVVIGDFAFWQYYGNLYAWDLTKNTSFLLCKLHGVKFAFTDKDSPPGPSNLLHAGNGLLCFLRWNMFPGKPKLACYRFRTLGYDPDLSSDNGDTSDLLIFSCGIKFFDIPGCALESAFALPPDLTERM